MLPDSAYRDDFLSDATNVCIPSYFLLTDFRSHSYPPPASLTRFRATHAALASRQRLLLNRFYQPMLPPLTITSLCARHARLPVRPAKPEECF